MRTLTRSYHSQVSHNDTTPLPGKRGQDISFIDHISLIRTGKKPLIPCSFISKECPGNGCYLSSHYAHYLYGVVNAWLQGTHGSKTVGSQSFISAYRTYFACYNFANNAQHQRFVLNYIVFC